MLTHNHLHTDRRYRPGACRRLADDVEYTLPIENLHAVMRRVARAMPRWRRRLRRRRSPGSRGRFGTRLRPCGDLHPPRGHRVPTTTWPCGMSRSSHAFIAYSRRMYDELLRRLPHRAGDDFSSVRTASRCRRRRRPAARRSAALDLRRPIRAAAERDLRPAGDRSRPAGAGDAGGVDVAGRAPTKTSCSGDGPSIRACVGWAR